MKRVKDMVAEANSQIRSIPAAEAKDLLGREDVQFIDLRDVRELQREGLIPGAFHCPRGMLEFWVDPESPYAKPVFQEDRTFVFYCQSGWRSALSTLAVQQMGLPKVAHIVDGFSGWKKAEGPIEEKEKK